MEIHRSSIAYATQNKNQRQTTGELPHPKEKFPHNIVQKSENSSIIADESLQTEFIPADPYTNLKQPITKTVLSSTDITVAKNQHINSHTLRALKAYKSESNQFSNDNSAHSISDIDYFV